MEELIIVLTYAAIVGGVPQSITIQQPSMEVCLERAEMLQDMDTMVGAVIDGQLTVMEVGERRTSCKTITVAQLFNAE